MAVKTQAYALTRSAAMLTLLSVLGPLSGLAMEMALAWRYGASGTVDAFRIASLLGSLGIGLFFGYLLPHVVVPMFADCRAKGREEEGWRLAFTLALLLTAILSPFLAWLWLAPEALVDLLGPGLTGTGQMEAALLLRCFGLAFLLMAWSGVASGVFFAHRLFWPSALSQLLPNLGIVLAIVAGGAAAGADALVSGVLLGYLTMFLLFAYGLLRLGRQVRLGLAACLKPVSWAVIARALHLSIPLLLTILIGQWSVVVLNRALSGMPPGTLAEFGYAWKLLMLVNLLPAGLATVVFPAFSDAHANRDTAELARLVTRAFRMTLLLTLPPSIWLWLESMPVAELAFGRGGMDTEALAQTGVLFAILLVGAPASTLTAALSKVAISKHDPKTPAIAALIAAVVITALLPSTVSASEAMWVFNLAVWAGCLVVLVKAIHRYRLLRWAEVARYFVSTAILGLLAATPILALQAVVSLPSWLELPMSGALFLFGIQIFSRHLGIRETAELMGYLAWQCRRWLPFGKARG